MTPEPAGALPRGAVLPPSELPPAGSRHLRLVEPLAHVHDWRLRDTEYVDGQSVRRLECDGCGGVDYT